jgi:hypothetical protein
VARPPIVKNLEDLTNSFWAWCILGFMARWVLVEEGKSN